MTLYVLARNVSRFHLLYDTNVLSTLKDLNFTSFQIIEILAIVTVSIIRLIPLINSMTTSLIFLKRVEYPTNEVIKILNTKYDDKVKIELSKSTNNLFIKIEDNGPGIPEKEYENVFKPFYKIDKGRADSKSSVGLGLSIASDIIRSHGGNIKLERSSMNGLGVKIFLPV